DGTGRGQAFVISETGGSWGAAVKVPGVGGLNRFGMPIVHDSVSCASAGNCAAVGSYRDGASRSPGVVVSETNGTWGTAIQVPGSQALNAGLDVRTDSVSCTSAGNCTAAGFYFDGVGSPSGRQQVFVVRETNGTWGQAIKIPGPGLFDAGQGA